MLNFSTPFRAVLVFFLLALRLPVAAQAPAWQSARAVAMASAAATSGNSHVTATAVDAMGNVYLAGYFTTSVELGSTTLTSLGRSDVFVTKFNPTSNQFMWAQRAGGQGEDRAMALAVSGTSVYVVGYFESTTAGFGLATLTNSGIGNVFVAKLTDAGSTGSFVWAQRAGGTMLDVATALAVSGTSVYVAGYFYSASAGFGATTLTSTGGNDVFVAKLTDAGSTGSFVWAQRAGGTGDDFARALAVNGNSVYLAGSFNGPTVGFGPIMLLNTSSTSTSEVFVAKLTDAGSTGSFAWAQRAGGTGDDRPYALAVSGTSVYLAGYFGSSMADFGAATLANAGLTDMFVAKLTDTGSTGMFAWALRAGSTGDDRAYALAVSGTSVYVAGAFNSPTAGFGSTALSTTGLYDVFVAKLTDAGSAGSFSWAQRAGGSDFDIAYALALSGTSIYVGGIFISPTATFGNSILTNTNSGSPLGFLASLTDPTLTSTTTAPPREPAALFPNPARRTATLRLPAGTPGAPLTLTDAVGRVVRRYPAPAGPETALDLGGLPAGLYLLRGAGPAQRLAVE